MSRLLGKQRSHLHAWEGRQRKGVPENLGSPSPSLQLFLQSKVARGGGWTWKRVMWRWAGGKVR